MPRRSSGSQQILFFICSSSSASSSLSTTFLLPTTAFSARALLRPLQSQRYSVFIISYGSLFSESNASILSDDDDDDDDDKAAPAVNVGPPMRCLRQFHLAFQSKCSDGSFEDHEGCFHRGLGRGLWVVSGCIVSE